MPLASLSLSVYYLRNYAIVDGEGVDAGNKKNATKAGSSSGETIGGHINSGGFNNVENDE